MKFAVVFLGLVALVASASIGTGRNVKIADKNFLQMQKFLFEIVYRIEDPLVFEEWIKKGDRLIIDQSQYSDYDIYMEKFYEAYKSGALLPKGEFFGALVKTHSKQALGLFNFFYYAKNWETFMRNVCWARINVNEGMFVQALTLAVIHRDDLDGLILPSIYEIFPQHFFNSKFVYEAEKFDFDTWSKITMYEKEYNDIFYKNLKDLHKTFYFNTRDWKTWQWWKMMGIGEHWYLEEKYLQRENIDEFNKDPKWLDIVKGTKWFYMPVDYTRDINIYNEHSKLSYFTEDLGWNAYWYYLNMDYAFFLDGKTFGLDKSRRGEYWLFNVQQLLARYYIERLANGFGDIPEFTLNGEVEHGYDPQLLAFNGVGFSYRKNYWEVESTDNLKMLTEVRTFIQRINNIIDLGYYKLADGTIVDLRKPDAIELIGNLMQGNIDTMDKHFFANWIMLSHMSFADAHSNDIEVFPNVFLNFETMMRDPMFYMVYKKVADVFYRFKYHLKPYHPEQLFYSGVTIKNVQVSPLVTYFDLVDTDVTNMLNDKMTFVDGEFVWDKTLLARQMRLNHKPFNFEITIESDKPQNVIIRTFLGPKFDEFGRVLSLNENRENFVAIDQVARTLVSGKNIIKRSSNDFFTYEDRTTYTELYKYVLLAAEGKYEFPLDISEPHCAFPDRLVLPRGWVKGMPVQLFFMVTPQTKQEQIESYDKTYSCGIGAGSNEWRLDDLPLGYPFDRTIDEFEFFVPNMYFKDVKIYYEDRLEKYWQNKYEHFGTFDYNF